MTFGFSNMHQVIDFVIQLWRMIVSSNVGNMKLVYVVCVGTEYMVFKYV